MDRLLTFISFHDLVPLVLLILLLFLVGSRIMTPGSTAHRMTRALTLFGMLGYAGLGIYTWRPAAPMDFLEIGIRALLAGGLVFGAGMIVLPIIGFLYHATVGLIFRTVHRLYAQWRQRTSQVPLGEATPICAHDAEGDAPRRAAQKEAQERQARERTERAEEARKAECRQARDSVLSFYHTNEQDLREFLPEPLLHAQVQARLRESLTPEQAWEAARDMIASMLPLVAQARQQERDRAQAEARKAERLRRLERTIRQLEEQRERLTSSPATNPDVVADEIREIQRQLRQLQDEREALDSNPERNPR